MKRTDIDLIVYDFDGVMTDNRVYVTQDGIEFVACNRADGLGVDMIRALGIVQMIISTETNPVVRARAGKLKLDVIHGVGDKLAVLLDVCGHRGIDPARVLYVGNDVNDFEAMQAVGHRICPADAHRAIRDISDRVLETAGGAGVVRELADLLSAH